jgi:hypothetical protein
LIMLYFWALLLFFVVGGGGKVPAFISDSVV